MEFDVECLFGHLIRHQLRRKLFDALLGHATEYVDGIYIKYLGFAV